MAFNLTAQLNLQGPTNVKQIAAQIKKDLGNINANVTFKLDPAVTKNVAALSSALKGLNATFGSTTTSATSAAAAIKAFGNSINSVKINNVPQQINAAANAVNKLNKASASSAKDLGSAAAEMQEFGKQAGLAIRRFVAFSTVTSVIYGLTNSISQGVQAFIDYDKELVKLQQVTGESSAGLAKLQEQITTLSTTFGVSSKDLTSVASTLAQAGLSARETEKALRALALSSLAPSFDDMNETVEGSIALMRQFGISADDLEAALGAVNTVAARFAVESSDIITAVQRTGSVFATASKGVSEGKDALNEFIAVFTSVRATTRESAETIATGLRTIFTRIQRGNTIDALKEFGVNLTDTEGKFVGAYKAVELLSKGLSGIDPRSLQFSKIVEELGGFRQIGKVIPLIQQFTVAQDALKTAQAGQGSLAKDAATAQLSLANQISKVRQEFFALFREIGQSKGFQSLIRGALSLASGLIKVTDAIKGILPALAIITAFKGAKALTQFASGFSSGVKRGPDGKANGGVIRKFARGGVVPGTGSGDTVPAMLEPGEFVIRKKAVETIGADQLHGMNKYGGGGSIRSGRSGKRKKFAAGGAARIDKIVSIDDDDFKDGDTFAATVMPKAESYKEDVRIGTWDAWEKRNPLNPDAISTVRSVKQIDKIKGLNKNKPSIVKFLDDNRKNKKVPGDAIVYGNQTALELAEEATGALKTAVGKRLDGKSASEAKIRETRDQTRNARLLIDGIDIDDKYKTGRIFKNLGGKIQKFMAGGTVNSPKLINRGGINYSLEDILKAGLTEEQFLEKIPVPPPLMAVNPKPGEYGTQFKIGGVGSGSVPMPKSLKPYTAPPSASIKKFLKNNPTLDSNLNRPESYRSARASGRYRRYAIGGDVDPKDTLERFYIDSAPFNLGLANSGELGKDQRNQLASDVRDMRKLRSPAPEKLYSSISRVAFDTMASQVGLNKNPKIPEGTRLFDKAKYYSEEVKKIIGKVFSLPGFVSTSKRASDAKSFLDNAPRADDQWAAMMTILTKPNAQGIDVASQLSGRTINATKKDINPRTGKMETFSMNQPGSENEFTLSPRSRFKIDSAKFADMIGRKNLWMDVQQFADGGQVERRLGIIDTDVLRDPANASIVGPEMEKLGITKVSEYSRRLAQLAAEARKNKSLSRLTAIAGSAGSGKSSLATGRGAPDNASLRKTIRSPILRPADIANVNEVIALTSTASEDKLESYLKDVDRAYILSSSTEAEQERISLNRTQRDATGEGLYGRKPGITNTAPKDFTLEESILRDELGSRAVVLGRKESGFGLRRKKENELSEIIQAGGYYTGGFAPPTRGHRGAFDTLLGSMISRNPNASAQDIVVSVAPNLPMDRGEGDTDAEKLAHASRYGIFPADFRTLLAGINFPGGMISTESSGRGDVLPKMMEVQAKDGRRRFAKLNGALAITSGKKAGALSKYERAGVQVTDIPRIDDISATSVRDALFNGDDATLMDSLSPEVASILMGNRAQLRNRSIMVPMLIEEITKYGATQKAQTNAEIKKMLAEAPGGPYGKITKTARENAPDVVAQVEAMREQRDALSESLLGYRAHNIISLLSAKYPDAYGLDPSRRASVSVQPSDLTKDAISAQLSESMSGEFGGVSTAMPSGLEAAILKNVEKATQVKKSSGILPAQGTEILKRFGAERLPNDPSFGPFSGKTVRDTADGGKLKYWNSAFRPETKADKLAYYTATRDYLIDRFNQSQGTQKATTLAETTNAVLSSTQLGLVGLNPLGYTGLLGPETWNLGVDSSGQERSIDASIIQRGLPTQYKSVIDYLSGQTEELVGGASKLLGISPKKLSQKERETLGQGNIEGALLEQIFGSAGADILDDALRTRPIDFPMGIGPKAASIFGIDPDIPTEVKRTIDSGSRGKAVEEFQRYFRQQYGIPDPEKTVQKLARGGKASRRFTFSKEPIGPSPFETQKAKIDYYSLEKDSGFKSGEFDMMVQYAKTNAFNLDEFKDYLNLRASRKAALSGVKTDFSSFLTPETLPEPTAKQQMLAEMLKGEPDPGYRPMRRYSGGGEIYDEKQLVALAKYRAGTYGTAKTDSEFINRYLENNRSFKTWLDSFHANPTEAYESTAKTAKDLLTMFESKESLTGSKRSGKLYSGLSGGKLKNVLSQIGTPLNSNKDIPDAINKTFNLAGSLLSTSESVDTATQFLDSKGSTAFMSIMRDRKSPSIDVDKTIFDIASEDDVIERLSKYYDKITGKLGADITHDAAKRVRMEREFILPPSSKFRIDDIDSIRVKDQEDKFLGGDIRHIEGMRVQQFAKGGSAQDTVPALLTPGEFVINKKAAQNIGYGKLERLNKADKIQGYNKGGIVAGGVIQRFATGGSVFSIEAIMQGLKGLAEPAVQKLKTRPETIDSKSIEASSELFNNVKLLAQGFEEAGYSMISFNKVLDKVAAGADISYNDIEKAMTKDVERLKITGASIDTIIEAEKALKTVRDQSKTAIVKRQFLEAGLKESKTGKALGSGGAQQAILTEAEKKEKLITRQRKSQIEKDLIKKDPSLLGDKDKLERRTNRRLEKEQRQIKEQAFTSATEKVTGIKRSELSGMGIGGSDIQSYVSQSMTDRKTLAQMDKQLIAMRLEEYKNAGTVRGVSVKSASEALSLAKEEVRTRREMINEMAAEQGEKGVGAADFMDFRNSPIKKAVQERYFSGTMSQGIGTALGDVGMVAGLVGGQGKNIANLMYDTSTDQGKIAAAGKGAAIEQAGSTLATGLTTASQLMAINPMLGAAVAIGTALYAASDAVFDFTGAQETAALEMEKNLRFEEVAASEKDLAKAFKDFEKDLGNIDLQKALDKALVRSSESSLKAIAAETKVAENEKGKTRTWLGFLSGAEKPKMDVQDINELASKQAERNADSGDKAFALISQRINTGASLESIQADKELIGARRALVLADEDSIKTVRARIVAEGGYDKVSQQRQDAILDEVAAEKILTNTQLQTAVKTKQMSDALDAADKAGRKLAASFEKLSSIVSESVNRIKFESDVRKSSAEQSRSSLRGQSEDRGPKLRELNVLENPNAYSEEDFNQALQSATAGVDEKTRNQLIGGAQLQQQLPNAITKSIADKLSTNADLNVDQAKAEAIKATNEQIDKTNLSDEQKTSLKKQAETRINKLAEDAKEKNDTPQAELDAFREGLGDADNILGAFGIKTLEAVKALSSFKQGALADFSEGLRESSKAAKDAQNYFKKARDISVQGDMNLREVMTGVGESYDEKQARIMGDVAGLAGGQTTVGGIKNRMVNLQGQRTAVEEKRQGMSDPNELKRSAEELRSLDDQLRDTREALDTLASSTELVEQAFNDLKNVRELQKNRESFVNTLLTNTPEEADKLNKTFIRLQRNLSGGLNAAGNQRDARKAFNQTLRETGSVREATKAGNTVLANQRKETLALSQDSGVRAAQELQIRNQYAQQNKPGADQAVADYFKQQQLQLTKSMAIESGMMNNPLVRQSIAAMENPNADPAMKEASSKYLQSVGLQADATKAQGELALLESQQALVSANANLKVSIDDLRTTIEASMLNNDTNEGRVIAPGGAAKVPLNIGVAAPVPPGRARGGLIYASEGQLVNFQPQGTDTVPAMLTPGEFVINARSTAEHLPLLKAINSGNYSKGGVVYLAQGGSVNPEGQKRKEERIDAQKESWMMSEATGRRPDEVVSRTSSSWAQSQVGDGRWMGMTEDERQSEAKKYEPEFQSRWDNYNNRQNDAQLRSANDAGYDSIKEDPNSGIVGVNFYNEEKKRATERFEKASAAETEALNDQSAQVTKPDMSYTTSVVQPSSPVPLVKMDTVPSGRGVGLKVRPDEQMVEERRNKITDRNRRMALNAIHPDKRTPDQQSRLDALMETQPNREEGRLRSIGRDKRTKEENETYETLREERLARTSTVSPAARAAYAKVDERSMARARSEAGLPQPGQYLKPSRVPRRKEDIDPSNRLHVLWAKGKANRSSSEQDEYNGLLKGDTSSSIASNPATEQREVAEVAATERKMAEDQTTATKQPGNRTANNPNNREEIRAGLSPITSNGGKPDTIDPATSARINEGYSRPSNAQQVAEQNASIESGIRQKYTTNKPLQKPDPNDPKYQTRNPLKGMVQRIADNNKYKAAVASSSNAESTNSATNAGENQTTYTSARVSAEEQRTTAETQQSNVPQSSVVEPTANQTAQTQAAASVSVSPGLLGAMNTATSSEGRSRDSALSAIDNTRKSIAKREQILAQEQQFDAEFQQLTESGKWREEHRDEYKKQRREQVVNEQNQAKLDAQTAEIDNRFNKFLAEGKVKENQREQYTTEQRSYMPKPIMESMNFYNVPTAEQIEQDQVNSAALAQFDQQQQMTAAEKTRAQQQKAEEDRQASLWINSSNPATAAAGYVGGVTQGIGDALYGAANITAGAVATVASPIVGGIGYAMSGDDTAFQIGDENNLRNRTAENMYDEARANGRPMPSPQEIVAAQDAAVIRARVFTENSNRLNNQPGAYSAATRAAAEVGVNAMGAGAMSFVEAGQAVAGMGPIQNGTETALQRNDARNVELAGGMDSYLGFATAGFQTAGYASSQAVGALINAEGAVTNVAGRAISSGARMAGRVVPGAAGAGRVAGRVAGTVDRAITGTARGAGRLGGRIPGASGAGRAVNNFVEGVQDVATQMGDVIGVRGIAPDWAGPRVKPTTQYAPTNTAASAASAKNAKQGTIYVKPRPGQTQTRLGYDPAVNASPQKSSTVYVKPKDGQVPDATPPGSGSVDDSLRTKAKADADAKAKLDASKSQTESVNKARVDAEASAKAKSDAAVKAKADAAKIQDDAAAKTKAKEAAKAQQDAANKAKADAAVAKADAKTSTGPSKAAKTSSSIDSAKEMSKEEFLSKLSSKESSAYDILGVQPGTSLTSQEVRDLVRKYNKFTHPDLGGSAELQARLNKIVELASDPDSLSQYDMILKNGIRLKDGTIVRPSPDRLLSVWKTKKVKGQVVPFAQSSFADLAPAGTKAKSTASTATATQSTKKAPSKAELREQNRTSVRSSRQAERQSLAKMQKAELESMTPSQRAQMQAAREARLKPTPSSSTKPKTSAVPTAERPKSSFDSLQEGVEAQRKKQQQLLADKSQLESINTKILSLQSQEKKGFFGFGKVSKADEIETLQNQKRILGAKISKQEMMDSSFKEFLQLSNSPASKYYQNSDKEWKRILEGGINNEFRTYGLPNEVLANLDPDAGIFGQLRGSYARSRGIKISDSAANYSGFEGVEFNKAGVRVKDYDLASSLRDKNPERFSNFANSGETFYGLTPEGGVRIFGKDSTGRPTATLYNIPADEVDKLNIIKKLEALNMPKFNQGGIVYANNGALVPYLSQGTDTVPAMLTPGEFVVNREASQQHMPLLHAINSGHFNRGGIVNYLANGGIVAPKYYANAGPVTGGSGGSSGVSNDISSSISAAVGQAMNEAVGQLSTTLQSGMETYSQMMQSSTETLNNFGQTFSSASQTIASSANTWSETASQIPTSLTAEVTGRQVVDFTGLGKEGDRIVSSAAQAGQLAGSQTSQNTMAKYDRSQFDGNLNTAANNRPMRT